MKGSSVLQNISKGISSLQKRCVNIFDSQVGRDKPSLHELNKDILVYSQAEGQGPPGKPQSMIIVIKAMKSKSKKQFPTWSQNWLPPCNNPTPVSIQEVVILHLRYTISSSSPAQSSCFTSFWESCNSGRVT